MSEAERQAWEAARDETFRRGREEGFYEGVENIDSFKKQMTELLEQMQQLIAGLGTPQEGSTAPEDGPVFEYEVQPHDFEHRIRATMVIRGGKYVIRKGSESRGKWCGEAEPSEGTVGKFRYMRKDGTLSPAPEKEGAFVFTRDCPFGNSSRAGQFVCGKTLGGPNSWREIGTGKTLKQWKKENP